MVRFILILLAIPIVLILAAAILIPLFVDQEQILALATEAVHKQTGATLTVDGEADFQIFPKIGLQLSQAKLAMPGDEQPSLSAGSLNIGVQLKPLFSGTVKIDAIELDGLQATLKSAPEEPALDTSQMTDKQLDEFYAARRRALEEAGKNSTGAALAVPLALEVKKLSVTNSSIRLEDAAGGKPTVIELQSFQASGLNLDGKPIPLTAKVQLVGEPGATPIKLSLDGNASIDLNTQMLQLADLAVSVTGATPETITLQANGSVNLERQAADLTLTLASGEIKGDGKLRYATFESPQIDANLHFNLLDPALLILAGPEAAAADSESSPEDASSGDEPLPLDALRLIDTRAELKVDRAVFDVHTISNLHAKLRALEGVVRLTEVTGELHGGKLELQATLDGQHNTAKLNTKGQLAKLDIATALTAMASEPMLTGTTDLNWQLDSAGRSSNELMAGLQGVINLDTQEVILQNLGLEKMLCQAVALVNQESLGTDLPERSEFKSLDAEINLAGGIARLDPLRAELPHLGLTGDGEYDLSKQNFSARFEAKLAPELGELAPACRVNERLTSIGWPVACSGELSGAPGDWCKVDTSGIVKGLLKNEGKRKLEKEAGKLFDKFLKKD